MPVLAVLLQVVPQVTPQATSAWEQFGPFAICAILATGIIGWLLKDRAAMRKAYQDDIAAHRAQLDAERTANVALTDRLIASVERTAPILERAAHALETAGAR